VANTQKVHSVHWAAFAQTTSGITKRILGSLIYHSIVCDFQGKTVPLCNNGRADWSKVPLRFILIEPKQEIWENANRGAMMRRPQFHSFHLHHGPQCHVTNLMRWRPICISGRNIYSNKHKIPQRSHCSQTQLSKSNKQREIAIQN
jgi:hypothetical protein